MGSLINSPFLIVENIHMCMFVIKEVVYVGRIS